MPSNAWHHNHAWQHKHAQHQPCNLSPKMCFYSPQAFSSSHFQCRDDVSETKQMFRGLKRDAWHDEHAAWSLTPHTSTTACAQHVALLCQGVLIMEGAALYPCNRVWYSALLPCLNVTAAGVTCSIQCLYKSSALNTLGKQLLAGLLRGTEDSNIVKL